MKRLFLSLLAMSMFCTAGCAGPQVSVTNYKNCENIVFLHTNDTHGFDKRGDGHHGMAAVAAYRQYLLKQGKQVILLDAGDAIQDNNLVNLSKGKTAIAFMNAAGYDAGTVGNHGFDYGQDELAKRLQEARYPIVSSNIYVEATGRHLMPATTILERNGVKIGIVGMTTPQTITSTNPKNVRGLRFLSGKELYAEVASQVKSLRKQGCDIVVALGHLGSQEDSIGNRSNDVLANVDGIDIFIDGHDHQIKNQMINGALLVETGSHTKNIGKVSLKDGKWTGELVPFEAFSEEDPAVKALVDEADRHVCEHLGQIIGKSQVALSGERVPGVRTQEMPLGDLVAEAFLWQARQATVLSGRVDAAIVNGGSLRKPIKKGNVTRADIHAVLPYSNYVYVATLSGAKLLEILEVATSALPDGMGAFPQVAGIRYEVDLTTPYEKGAKYEGSLFHAPAKPGSRVKIVEVGGKPFDDTASYNVCMTDFLLQGGDSYAGLAMPGACTKQDTGYTDADALENYIRSELHGVIGKSYAKVQGRVVLHGAK